MFVVDAIFWVKVAEVLLQAAIALVPILVAHRHYLDSLKGLSVDEKVKLDRDMGLGGGIG